MGNFIIISGHNENYSRTSASSYYSQQSRSQALSSNHGRTMNHDRAISEADVPGGSVVFISAHEERLGLDFKPQKRNPKNP